MDYFNAKYGEGNTSQNFKVTLEMEDHMRNRQLINPKTNKPYPNQTGIVGAHNSNEFLKNDVHIFNREKIYDIYGNEILWTEKVYYNMPALDTTGKPIGNGSYSTSPKQKTIYNPELISDQEYCRRAAEAANNALSEETSGVLPHIWEGIDSQGVKWIGYFENGKITSFFPTN